MREVYGIGQNDAREHIKWTWHESTGYVFPPRWRELARRRELHGQDYRLLFGMLSYMGWGNRCDASLGMIEKRIGMDHGTANRCLRRLERARLIAVDRSDTRGLVITVSPYLVWQGRPPGVYDMRKAWSEMCAGTLPASAAAVPETDADATPTTPVAEGILPSHPGGESETGADPSLLQVLEEVVGSLRQ